MATGTDNYRPRYPLDRYPMMVLRTGPLGVEFFDEFVAQCAAKGLSESEAEGLLILHWPELVAGMALPSDQLAAAQALVPEDGAQ